MEPTAIVHARHKDTHKLLCGANIGLSLDRWSADAEEITCPNCRAKIRCFTREELEAAFDKALQQLRLNPHSEQLIRRQLAGGGFHSPEEVIERALEAFAEKKTGATGETQRQAVRDMLDFVKQNRVRLENGLSVKDLIDEGHRV